MWYSKTTKDLLLNRTLPGYTGFASVIDNVGSVENKGMEFAISGDPIVGTVKWNSGFNISWNRNKVLDLGETSKLEYKTTYGGYSLGNGFMQLRVGEPFGQMYGYGYEGPGRLEKLQRLQHMDNYRATRTITDFNNDGKINASDIMKIGNSIPDFIFGWNNRISYSNFELSFLIQGSKGNDIFNEARIRLENSFEGTSVRMLDAGRKVTRIQMSRLLLMWLRGKMQAFQARLALVAMLAGCKGMSKMVHM